MHLNVIRKGNDVKSEPLCHLIWGNIRKRYKKRSLQSNTFIPWRVWLPIKTFKPIILWITGCWTCQKGAPVIFQLSWTEGFASGCLQSEQDVATLRKNRNQSFHCKSPLCTGATLLSALLWCFVLDIKSQSRSSLIGVAWLHTLQMLRSWFTVSFFAASFSQALGEHLPGLNVLSIISQSTAAWDYAHSNRTSFMQSCLFTSHRLHWQTQVSYKELLRAFAHSSCWKLVCSALPSNQTRCLHIVL